MINLNNNCYSLYIHIPWCLKKCPYCDFYSLRFLKNKKIIQNQYINSLLLDLKSDLLYTGHDICIENIFLGGGTPSLINPKLISYLLSEIKNIVHVKKESEITIEINPSSISEKNILTYIKSGINRFSLGIQSFNNSSLKSLGRLHTAEDAINAIRMFNKKKKLKINLDIIYGIPGQTLKNACDDIYQAISFKPNHISWYQLTIEKNTIFGQYPPKDLLNDDFLWKIFIQGEKIFKKAKYMQYEISSFIRNQNDKCKHNLNYWYFGNYLGIGCSAHGKLIDLNGNIIRTVKNYNIKQYIKGSFLLSKKKILNNEKIFEFFLNRLRVYNKIYKKEFMNKTGINVAHIDSFIKKALKLGYLQQNNDFWILTTKGHLFLNDLLEIFI
ncbi:radical SAM family heme chaperone HemW [Enterobacteriaceae endosymbiont of Donacia tomentosa]|uniref:radical SAM family heme chaperone HemW n=1 Tax=Enterobacteriaceae endosymbiont of Donacia tomentosa TaxID=2675787 RepID=UPI0014493534|nr:radical SAM family heme chaperone HemW [Enterobacteriaceae endosymbiont of Donacia tomentosa]QJC31716.1 radical SAM family heme chaperone HemW [Enterobacteriaceae endosymbiont of Donacia tomentosa]